MNPSNQNDCLEQLGIASVPKQQWCPPYDMCTALKEGTIFPTMNRIMEISFAINDLTLYLDTHPDCQNGISLFYQLMEERLILLADYANKFNPLTQTSMVTGECDKNVYGWAEGPMPWEGACI